MIDPRFAFFLGNGETPVFPGTDLWRTDLVPSDVVLASSVSPVSLGDYFESSSSFLSENDFHVLCQGVENLCGHRISSSEFQKVVVTIVKHGEFYHPAKVRVDLNSVSLFFVLNFAVSEAGTACVEREFLALTQLASRVSELPRVYGKGWINIRLGCDAAMFLGQWFDGYHEFHVSFSDDGKKEIRVWDDQYGTYSLLESDAFVLYEKAASILTRCYNPMTCEQIQPWHHAAGDFVVKSDKEGIDVRLITARQYTSIFDIEKSEENEPSLPFVMEALFVFFISLSIRMRLDREDGVKDAVFLDDFVLLATVSGFLKGLHSMSAPSLFSAPLADCFLFYVSQLPPESVVEFAHVVLASYHPESSDYPLVSVNLDAHIAGLIDAFQSYL